MEMESRSTWVLFLLKTTSCKMKCSLKHYRGAQAEGFLLSLLWNLSQNSHPTGILELCHLLQGACSTICHPYLQALVLSLAELQPAVDIPQGEEGRLGLMHRMEVAVRVKELKDQ